MAADNIETRFAQAQLRSSSADLSVVLGEGDNATTKRYHSQALACKSRYIDAMLSTPMKEQDEKVVTFPDIAPELWDEMMKFLDSPAAILRMTPKDALRVAVPYDKYEFVEGTKLCDLLLADYFESLDEREKDFSVDPNFYIESMSVAHEANLDGALSAGIKYIWGKMRTFYNPPYASNMFTEKQMDRLLPILLDAFSGENGTKHGFRPLPPNNPNNGKNNGGIDEGDGNFYRVQFDLKLDDPGFSKIFLSKCTQRYEGELLLRCISHLELLDAQCEIDGVLMSLDGVFTIPEFFIYHHSEFGESCKKYESPKKISSADYVITFYIEKTWENTTDEGTEDDFYGWAICARHTPHVENMGVYPDKLLWTAPCSQNLNFPPKSGWKSYDPKAEGHPSIKYILNKEV